MEGFSLLLVFCASMFAGAYLAGMVPLMFTYNIAKLRWVTIFGAGLLVGTALVVIIPEGVAMHYESQLRHEHVTHLPPGVKVAGGGAAELSDDVGGEAPPGALAAAGGAHEHHAHAHARRLAAPAVPAAAQPGAHAGGAVAAAVEAFVGRLAGGPPSGRSLRRSARRGGRKGGDAGDGAGTNAADIGSALADEGEDAQGGGDEGDETTVVSAPLKLGHRGDISGGGLPADGASAVDGEDDSYRECGGGAGESHSPSYRVWGQHHRPKPFCRL